MRQPAVPAEYAEGGGTSAAREARRRARRGSRGGRIVSRVARASIALARALLGQRSVGTEDTGWIVAIAVVLLLTAGMGFLMPRFLAWPLAFLMFWIGLASIYRAVDQRRRQ